MKADGCSWMPHQRLSNSASTSNHSDEDLNESKEAAYQLIIGISGALSIASLLCLCLVVPSLYGYVDTISSFSIQDFKYCEVWNVIFLGKKMDWQIIEKDCVFWSFCVLKLVCDGIICALKSLCDEIIWALKLVWKLFVPWNLYVMRLFEP